ncbi:hypothetical protein B0I72DRAFT_141444 [Yarrowia lipolytica]|jgi:hypothetical protein|uniref:YALI0C04565p n=2 Tax=Yarrowia lipolytica TaxID=4952 RepID=Q6CD15_YARLI|nr:YALI0C04565p [Yarrowia lipolytica CLIB122]AOW02340.1 hypothetical protein YALI1_C06071g [Yarrowia lipolytica]KAB8283187.1 hypothetical protein BKA91DRAFT_137284 [Yarrowia lipolytica]KAE8173894.1 hypothetical protein BKA90DRAFT_134834 [Yarrowia lipolytica]KAJ8053063.1 hypothetical protein LXG23DRAFT_54655 [Yarrowia lipolytica]QNP97457.1 Hypothetical protein YALI2_C01110g [Yarrowia lipolytica]|eukprot:XP_501447.1 YALI0C04565p [Yarrowia lipolytica CLIB122]
MSLAYTVNLLRASGRLNKVLALLSNAGTLDPTLAFVGYGSLFVCELLRLESVQMGVVVAKVLLGQVTGLDIDESFEKLGLASDLTGVADSLGVLSGLISDIRIFNRLWGLVGLISWGISEYDAQQKPLDVNDPYIKYDKAVRVITALQVWSNLFYQPLENVAYLGMHKILPVSDAAQNSLWLHSSKLWALHVVLELIRLVVEIRRNVKRQSIEKKAGKTTTTTDTKACNCTKLLPNFLKGLGDQWWRDLVINLAYLPLTAHWSIDGGIVDNLIVGFLGASAAAANVGWKWKKALTPDVPVEKKMQ